MIHMSCPKCGKPLELDEGFVGGVARCKHCAAMFTVPADAHSEPSRVLESDADEAPAAPPRKKNRTVRTVTAVVFVGVLLVTIGVFVGAFVFVATAPTESEEQAAAVTKMHAAIEADPYVAPGLSALGVHLEDRAVVLVDADYRSLPWLEPVNRALLHGLTRPSNGAMVNLVYAADPVPLMLASALVDTQTLDESLITALMQRVEPDGTPALDEAVRLAMQFEPKQIVMIVGRTLSNDEVDLLRTALDSGRTRPQIDVVMIDKDEPALDNLAVSTGGLYVPISQRIVAGWQAPQ